GVCRGKVWRSPLRFLSPALALTVFKVLFKHRRLTWTGLEKSLDLIEKTFRNRSQDESTLFFSPSRGSAFFQPELLAQFGGNNDLSFGTDDGAVDGHAVILPHSKTLYEMS